MDTQNWDIKVQNTKDTTKFTKFIKFNIFFDFLINFVDWAMRVKKLINIGFASKNIYTDFLKNSQKNEWKVILQPIF